MPRRKKFLWFAKVAVWLPIWNILLFGSTASHVRAEGVVILDSQGAVISGSPSAAGGSETGEKIQKTNIVPKRTHTGGSDFSLKEGSLLSRSSTIFLFIGTLGILFSLALLSEYTRYLRLRPGLRRVSERALRRFTV